MSNSAPTAPDPQEVEALAALYSADRAELVGFESTTTNILAMSVAYIAATIALLPGDSAHVDGWVLSLVPLPVVLLSNYWMTILAMLASKVISARRLERRLHGARTHSQATRTGLSTAEQALVGMEAVEPLANLSQSNGFAKSVLTIQYVGAGFIVGGHIVVMLSRAWTIPHGHAAVLTVGSAYLFVGICSVGALRSYAKHLALLREGLEGPSAVAR
ncbi:hypothetical protein [Kribbella sindirgiensis]|uniref:Uncharacterized protein n=1 Tax=Kribbella sindirgiensis TaxID=1124744 RepID=A0A4R0IUI3_9ACTN|nr:hypothetical protein [Kribbella sindirgiensis]TCC35108.1 hypothetical protein E0H50_14680 [Kribbella sindirgiensis]